MQVVDCILSSGKYTGINFLQQLMMYSITKIIQIKIYVEY